MYCCLATVPLRYYTWHYSTAVLLCCAVPRTVLLYCCGVLYLHVQVVHGEAELYARRAVPSLEGHLRLRRPPRSPALSRNHTNTSKQANEQTNHKYQCQGNSKPKTTRYRKKARKEGRKEGRKPCTKLPHGAHHRLTIRRGTTPILERPNNLLQTVRYGMLRQSRHSAMLQKATSAK